MKCQLWNVKVPSTFKISQYRISNELSQASYNEKRIIFIFYFPSLTFKDILAYMHVKILIVGGIRGVVVNVRDRDIVLIDFKIQWGYNVYLEGEEPLIPLGYALNSTTSVL